MGDIELPEEFLKKWLVEKNENITAENVDEEYKKMLPAAKWQLIKEKVAKQFEIKVNDDDVKREAKILAAQQFAQYGMNNVPDEYIEKYAEDFINNKQYRQGIVDKAVEDKLFAAIKDNATVEEKTVSVDEFNSLFK